VDARIDAAVALSLRIGYAGLFLAAVTHKVADFPAFSATVRAFRTGLRFGAALPITFLAVAMIAAETAALLACLFAGSGTLPGALIGGILSLYAIAMHANIRVGNVLLDCGCSWGSERQAVTSGLVTRNVILAAGALLLVLPVRSRSLDTFDVASSLATVLAAAAVYHAANRLLGLSGTQAEARA
jgi:hypothetical protein